MRIFQFVSVVICREWTVSESLVAEELLIPKSSAHGCLGASNTTQISPYWHVPNSFAFLL